MSITVRLVAESSAPVGSSAKSSAGLFARARAMATPAFARPTIPARLMLCPVAHAHHFQQLLLLALAGGRAALRTAWAAPRALVRPIRLKVWNTKPIFWLRMAESCLSFAAATSTRPAHSRPRWGRSSALMMFIRVDLPPPLSPTMATNSPSCTVRSMPCRISSSLACRCNSASRCPASE